MNKLLRFNENERFTNVIQPKFDEVFNTNYPMKGKWHSEYFGNQNPIVLELGCGKGEYSIGLAQNFSYRNFIGIDIKGARLWKGAKYALTNNMRNVLFIRTRIDVINSLFAPDEISEIWITFPDPQLKKPLKRLTSSRFLNRYRKLLITNGIVHLKTDSSELYEYTLQLAVDNNLVIRANTSDLYNSELADNILSIRTFYESQFISAGKSIKYLSFQLPAHNEIIEPKPL